MNRRTTGVIAAVLLAAMGTFVLLAYVRSAEDRALAGEQVVEVFVVSEAIAEGTAAAELEGLVQARKVPAKVEAAHSVNDLASLEGKVAAVDLVPGEQLLSSRFVAPEALQAQGAVDVPDDLLEVTVALEAQRALGGRIAAGDTVAVLASFDPFEGNDPPGDEAPQKSPNSTHMILHKVLVSDVQGAAAAPAGEEQAMTAPTAGGEVLVTLALDAPSIERVVFAAEHGFVWLSADPSEAPAGRTRIQTRGTVYE